MKQILPVIILSLTALIGCNKKEDTNSSYSSSHYFEPYYKEVSDLHINWNDLFSIEKDRYCVYVYFVTCTACSMLREDIIEFSKKEGSNLYFIYPSEDITFTDNEEEADNSLGADNIEEVSIYTTPTLMEMNNKIITKYTRDYYEIRDYIES